MNSATQKRSRLNIRLLSRPLALLSLKPSMRNILATALVLALHALAVMSEEEPDIAPVVSYGEKKQMNAASAAFFRSTQASTQPATLAHRLHA